MTRKYTKVEELVGIIEQRHAQGETYREIEASLGLSRKVVKEAVKRKRRKDGGSPQDVFHVPKDAHAKSRKAKK